MNSQSLLVLTIPDNQVEDVSDQTKVIPFLLGYLLRMQGPGNYVRIDGRIKVVNVRLQYEVDPIGWTGLGHN